jgi:hypothetical protein
MTILHAILSAILIIVLIPLGYGIALVYFTIMGLFAMIKYGFKK